MVLKNYPMSIGNDQDEKSSRRDGSTHLMMAAILGSIVPIFHLCMHDPLLQEKIFI